MRITQQSRSDWPSIWLYNPRMTSLRHGFEEPGDVLQDIRLVVDTIPTLAWSALVQTARQSFTISAGLTIRVYLQSKLCGWWDSQPRSSQTGKGLIGFKKLFAGVADDIGHLDGAPSRLVGSRETLETFFEFATSWPKESRPPNWI
jgi:hypothetical protein